MTCNLFWQPIVAPKLTLSIPSLRIFNFQDGKLVSDYLDSSALLHEFSHNNAVTLEDDYPATGILSFILRAFLSPCTDTFDKIIVSLPFLQGPKVPWTYIMQFWFLSWTPLLGWPNKALGVPGFSSNSTWVTLSDSKPLPSGAALQLALSSILSSAVVPEVKLSLQTLNLRCQEILSNGVSVKNIDFSNLN